jgi:predicted ABC-type ATPase
VADPPPCPPCVYVLAGANGGGKSSVGGAAFRALGADYFNPDEAARRILGAHPYLTPEDANSAAWYQGKRLLERAIAGRLTFALETTLGGETMVGLLERAAAAGLELRVWYVALGSPDLHIARVASRVAAGGHDIPDATIRRRYDRSRINLIRLLPAVTELRLFDNSVEADPSSGACPAPRLILHLARGKWVDGCELPDVPHWARPILAAAMTRPQ